MTSGCPENRPARTSLTAAPSRLAEYADLLAAARASVAAAARGDADPVAYVRSLLAYRGQLPPDGASPLVILADARTALHLAREAVRMP
jgi:hypothetical protein